MSECNYLRPVIDYARLGSDSFVLFLLRFDQLIMNLGRLAQFRLFFCKSSSRIQSYRSLDLCSRFRPLRREFGHFWPFRHLRPNAQSLNEMKLVLNKYCRRFGDFIFCFMAVENRTRILIAVLVHFQMKLGFLEHIVVSELGTLDCWCFIDFLAEISFDFQKPLPIRLWNSYKKPQHPICGR